MLAKVSAHRTRPFSGGGRTAVGRFVALVLEFVFFLVRFVVSLFHLFFSFKFFPFVCFPTFLLFFTGRLKQKLMLTTTLTGISNACASESLTAFSAWVRKSCSKSGKHVFI
jgi:hypothetical protein